MPKNEETCECEVIHDEIVKQVKSTFPKDEMIFDLADFYKIFGDRPDLSLTVDRGKGGFADSQENVAAIETVFVFDPDRGHADHARFERKEVIVQRRELV